MFCLVFKCHHKSCWQLIVFMSSVLFDFIETKTSANMHLMKQICVFLFWQMLNHDIVSVEMEITTGWRRVLGLSFLMVGASVCLPSIRKGEENGFHEQSLAKLSERPSPLSCMTLCLTRLSLITSVDVFSEASHWGIPGRSPGPDA